MTFTTMTARLARMIQQNRIHETEDRRITRVSDFNEYDCECIDTIANQLRNLFYHSDGRMWYNVLAKIKHIAGHNFYLGFNAQQIIIDTCAEYGIIFLMEGDV